MKYPFTPDILDALPEELAELFRSLETTLIEEICSRLKIAGELNEVTVQDIRALRSLGLDLDTIKKAIAETSSVGMDRLNTLLNDVVERNQAYYSDLVDLAKVTMPDRFVNAADIDAIRRQTQEEFTNLTQSMGFLLTRGGQKIMLPPAKAYQWALDNAEMQVMSGAISYREAIKNAVKQLADSGIKTVNYESGHVDQADVAVRRAVMSGVSQLCDKYTVQSMEYLDTNYCEVSAHIGARDVEGKSPWSSHKAWQGRVYSIRAGDKYPNIYEVCGLGYVDGLEGANCRHKRFPFIEGVSERTYTDYQLEHIDDGHDIEYQGKYYTAYEATQQQRKIERTIRKLKRERAGYEAAGLTEDAQDVSIRIRRLNAEYKAFSEAAGLPLQTDRTRVDFFGGNQNFEDQLYDAARFKDTVSISPPPKGDAITHRSLYNNLAKTAVGAETIEYISSGRCNVEINYSDEAPKDERAYTTGNTIVVHAKNTRTIKETAKALVHEVTHAKYKIGGSQYSEVICFIREHIHENGGLTYADMRGIIKTVKELYPEYNWRKGGRNEWKNLTM